MTQKTKYMHLFETETEFNDARNNDYKEPWVSYTQSNSAVTYNKTEEEKKYEVPLTFEILGDGQLHFVVNSDFPCYIETKINDGEWENLGSAYIDVFAGDIVQFRGDNATYSSGSSSTNNWFGGTTCTFKAYGNIMSLINSTDFANLKTFQSAYTFSYLFYNLDGLKDVSDLLLPATALTPYCYQYMFGGFTGFDIAPALPATILADGCYFRMFYANGYLTTAPELPATTLVSNCYTRMFMYCGKLNYIKCLATDVSATDCTENWVSGVANSGTFVKNPNMTSWTRGNSGIPTNWTVQDA